MKRSVLSAVLVVLVFGLLAQVARAQVFNVGIEVSPRTLNVNSNGNRMTVHTDIPFVDVVAETVYLNWIGVEGQENSLAALEVKADYSGNLMAKFSATDVKADIPRGAVLMKLSGVLLSGTEFSGTDTIRVIKRGGRRRGPGR